MVCCKVFLSGMFRLINFCCLGKVQISWILMVLVIDVLCLFDEGFNKGICDVVEYRFEYGFQYFVGKFIVQVKFDFVGCIVQWCEILVFVYLGERVILKVDFYLCWCLFGIFCCEV